jgi:trans-2,3-dihydro-3-hydroxyanthranilic acid synthase
MPDQIPPIRPYRMPAQGPESAAPWRPDARRAVLLIHDMQRYFVERFPAGRAPVTDLVSNVDLLRRGLGALGVPTVYTAQSGSMSRERRGLLHDIWGPGMAAVPEHRDIIPALRPRPGDTLLDKLRYSAFHGSGLRDMLAAAGRDQLVICGVYAHLGCLLTACDAFSYDIETFLVADAVADFSERHHRLALQYAARACAVTPTTGALLDAVSRRRTGATG